MSKKFLILIVSFLGFSILSAYLTNNYLRDLKIREMNSTIILANEQVKFTISKEDVVVEEDKIFQEIIEIKKTVMNQFLDESTEKIYFNPIKIDTIRISISEKGHLNYYSSGSDDEDFAGYFENLRVGLTEYFQQSELDELEVYTFSPRHTNNVPLPPGTFTNANRQ